MKRFRKHCITVALVIFIGLLGACQGQTQNVEVSQDRIKALEAQVEELQTAGTESAAQTATSEQQIFQVAVATYLLDTAGFHGMDESINEEGTIEPQFLGTVGRVDQVLGATTWPAELQEDVAALRETLATLATALENDNVDAAGPAAADAHEQQHDLSHVVGEWLASQGVGDQNGHD